MTSRNTFKEGDLVVLKSAGPKMVVSGVGAMYDNYAVNCEWFAGAKCESALFNAATLKLAED